MVPQPGPAFPPIQVSIYFRAEPRPLFRRDANGIVSVHGNEAYLVEALKPDIRFGHFIGQKDAASGRPPLSGGRSQVREVLSNNCRI